MARTFRRQRTSQPISELNVTNLIDVAFTLLIIFMIATPLIQQEQAIRVDLPVESVSEQPRPDPRDRFETITIQADGRVQLRDRVLNLRALGEELDKMAAESRPPVVRLRIDAKANAQHWVSVMEELKKRNLSRISFDTQTVR